MSTPSVDSRFPDRCVVGVVPEFGGHTWFVQTQAGDEHVEVACARPQIAALAAHLESTLGEIAESGAGRLLVPPRRPRPSDLGALTTPLEPLFRVGTMVVQWCPDDLAVRIDLHAVGNYEARLGDPGVPPELVRVSLTTAQACEFVTRTAWLLEQTAVTCPACQAPLDPRGHVCVRINGFHRPLFTRLEGRTQAAH